MDNSSPGRPVEIQIATVDTVDVAAMDLITSMAFGERHASKMINMSMTGIVSPGVFSGFIPKVHMGTSILIGRDEISGISVAVVQVGLQQLRIFQQHDIIVELTRGEFNVVVLEGFFEDGVLTSQVSAHSGTAPATIRSVLKSEVTPDQLILCEIDLTAGQRSIDPWMLNTSSRASCDLNVTAHEGRSDPHQQYNPKQTVHIIDSNDDELSTTNVNLIVTDFSKRLDPLPDGTVIEIELLSSIDLDSAAIILTPPTGEVLEYKGKAGSSFELRRSNCKLYRVNGRWCI